MQHPAWHWTRHKWTDWSLANLKSVLYMNELGWYINNQFWYVDLTTHPGRKVLNGILRVISAGCLEFWYGLISEKSRIPWLCVVYILALTISSQIVRRNFLARLGFLLSKMFGNGKFISSQMLVKNGHEQPREKVKHHLKNTSKNYQHIMEWIHFPTFFVNCEMIFVWLSVVLDFLVVAIDVFFCPLVVSGKSLSQQRMDKSHLFRIFFRIPSSEPTSEHGGQRDSVGRARMMPRGSSSRSCGFEPSEAYLRGSENSGIPKSSILIGFSIIKHPIWGTPILETPICLEPKWGPLFWLEFLAFFLEGWRSQKIEVSWVQGGSSVGGGFKPSRWRFHEYARQFGSFSEGLGWTFQHVFFAIYGLFGRYVLRSHAFRLKIHDL